MILIKLSCDKKIREKLKLYNIDRRKLENLCNYLTNNTVRTNKWWTYTVDVKGIEGMGSQYCWDEDEIEIALDIVNEEDLKISRSYFVESFIREYRHWVQCRIQRVSGNKLNYTDDDIETGADAYYKNPYEVECVEWEKLIDRFGDML